MRLRLPSLRLLVPAILALAAGCAAADTSTGEGEDDVRAGERSILGRPKDYAADKTLRARSEALNISQKERRAVAWQALARILKETTIQEKHVKDGRKRARLPVFRTWYGKDDFGRMFAKGYGEQSADLRKTRTPMSDAAINALFDWNGSDRGAWAEDSYLDRVKNADTKPEIQGLGGNARVSYSPGVLRHVLKNYGTLSKCLTGAIKDDPAAGPPRADQFAPCFDEEAPADAAVIKASWLRADFGGTVPVTPTTPEALKARLAGSVDDGAWGPGATQATPDESSIYTVTMSDGSTFRMPGLHLITKELRDWLWISIWWSPDPDTDFGADRPQEIKALTGPWKNYKMCVVTGFDEGDADPTGGYPTGPGSLGDALKSVYAGKGAPSWCSNQYIERGAHNAQTNCIGCHQHAGTELRSEAVLADERKFPSQGRTKTRQNFPTDYVFAISSPPEGLGQISQTQIEHFDAVDR
jgi:hypothetical protein